MLSVSTLPSHMRALTRQEISVFEVDFPMDTSDVKFRAVQWICTEVLLAFAALWNLLPRESRLRRYRQTRVPG